MVGAVVVVEVAVVVKVKVKLTLEYVKARDACFLDPSVYLRVGLSVSQWLLVFSCWPAAVVSPGSVAPSTDSAGASAEK